VNDARTSTTTPAVVTFAILAAAALGGTSTLAAEMLWIRGLGRGVGTSYEAVAMVAGLFLAGLALGALLAARPAARSRRPARRGAIFLLGAGLWTALSPLYVARLADLHAALFDTAAGGLLAPLLLAAPHVLPAALCQGALYPFLVRARAGRAGHGTKPGAMSGSVYAASTAGAVLGVLGLLPALLSIGEALSLRTAGAAALLGTLLLLLVDRPIEHATGASSAPPAGRPRASTGLALALGASGAAALLAQLAWLRMLQPLAGAHLYGVALLLAPLLLAMAAGAGLAGALADRLRHPGRLVPALLAFAGAFTLLSLPAAGSAPLGIVSAVSDGGGRLAALVRAFLWTVAPATLLFGALLPAAVRVQASDTDDTVRTAGRLYAWNGFGALLGSLAAGFFLLPHLGAERTLFIAACLPIAAAVLLALRVQGPRRLLVASLHALPLLILLWPGLLATWLTSGPTTVALIAADKPVPRGLHIESEADLALYASWFAGRRAVRPGDASGRPLPVFEGRGGRITLIEEPDGRIGLRRGVSRENVFDGDDPSVPARTELALGLLPTLLHPAPHRALVIGHGAGWTAEAVLAAGATDVDVAEIDPAVLDAARAVRAVRGLKRLPVEADPHAHLRRVDGRVLLRRAARGPAAAHYDVIASQPSHPWHPASGHLFTEEAYAVAREALTPDGILAQWLNLFDMTPDLLRSALASFRAVFPEVWVYRFPDELVLLGFRGTPRLDAGRWAAFFAEDNARAGPARAAGFTHPARLWKYFALDAAGLDRILPRDVETFHDDLPRFELTLARRRLDIAPPEDPAGALLPGFPPNVAAVLPDNALRERWITEAVRGWLAEGGVAEAELWSRRLHWGFSTEGRLTQARAALAAGRPDRAETLLQAARRAAPARGDVAAAWIRVATALTGRGRPDRDERYLKAATALVRQMPEDGRVLGAAARMQRSLGRVAVSRRLLERAVAAKAPEAPAGTRIQLARLLLSEDSSDASAKRASELLGADPSTYTDIDAIDLLLRLLSAAGDETRAQAVEGTLATLQRARGLALFRRGSDLLARHDFDGAVKVAERCTRIWASEPAVFELEALAALAAAASPPDGAAPSAADATAFVEAGLTALREGIERSTDAPAARERAGRILRWFGHHPAELDAPEESEPQ